MQHSINISSYCIDVLHTDHLILVNTLRLFWCSAPGYIAAIVRSDVQISCHKEHKEPDGGEESQQLTTKEPEYLNS